jgi:hypothetical protein
MSSSRLCSTVWADRRNGLLGFRRYVRSVPSRISSILGFADRLKRRSTIAPLQLKGIKRG